MPDINGPVSGEERAFRNEIRRRLHALEATVPIRKDSVLVTSTFTTASPTYVTDGGLTVVENINCFGDPVNGTNVEVSGSCDIGLPSGTGGINGLIGVQVDGGTTNEPPYGPGFYYLALLEYATGGISATVGASRVIQVLPPAATQGLSQHSFAMIFASESGFPTTISFYDRALTIDPQ